MKQCLILFGFLLSLNACKPEPETQSSTTVGVDTANSGKEFIMETIPGSTFQHAIKKGQDGLLLEEGTTDAKGVKNGAWVIYQGEGAYPAKIANYINGVYNGPYFEFDGFGRMVLKASYKNNKLHGIVLKYLNGDLTQESNYKEGVLDGVYKEYSRNGILQKEINYKNGKLDGAFRYYDEHGKVNLEYLYKNGKQQ